MSPISPVSSIAPVDRTIEPNIASPGAAQKPSFQDVFSSAIQHVEASGANADKAAESFMTGGNQELHSTILAAQNAELDFEIFMQVRNKVVSAYEEIMKMQL